MSHLFQASELTQLQQDFALISAHDRNVETCIYTPELFIPERCEQFLHMLTPIIHSPSIKITASLLSKRLAFLSAASCLYAMSVMNKGLNFSAENCYLDFAFENHLWRNKMPLRDLTLHPSPTEALLSLDDAINLSDLNKDAQIHVGNNRTRVKLQNECTQIIEPSIHPKTDEHLLIHTHDSKFNDPLTTREVWRDQIIQQLFAEHLSRLWQVFVLVTKVNPRILWENTAVRVYLIYEKRMQSIQCPRLRQYIDDDFHYLLNTNKFEIFGLDYNPFTRFNHRKIKVMPLNEEVRFRKSCCFYYQASEPVEYCTTCPLIHPRLKNKHKI